MAVFPQYNGGKLPGVSRGAAPVLAPTEQPRADFGQLRQSLRQSSAGIQAYGDSQKRATFSEDYKQREIAGKGDAESAKAMVNVQVAEMVGQLALAAQEAKDFRDIADAETQIAGFKSQFEEWKQGNPDPSEWGAGFQEQVSKFSGGVTEGKGYSPATRAKINMALNHFQDRESSRVNLDATVELGRQAKAAGIARYERHVANGEFEAARMSADALESKGYIYADGAERLRIGVEKAEERLEQDILQNNVEQAKAMGDTGTARQLIQESSLRPDQKMVFEGQLNKEEYFKRAQENPVEFIGNTRDIDLTPDKKGFIEPQQIGGYIEGKIKGSPLDGFVPEDGEKFGITTGSPEEWARHLTGLAKLESSYNVNTVGDVGKFPGNSNGIFQLSPDDATNHGLQETPFSQEQLTDPQANIDASLAIYGKLVKQDGVIAAGKKGAARYWGPLQRGVVPSNDEYEPAGLPLGVSPADEAKAKEVAYKRVNEMRGGLVNGIKDLAEMGTITDVAQIEGMPGFELLTEFDRHTIAEFVKGGALNDMKDFDSMKNEILSYGSTPDPRGVTLQDLKTSIALKFDGDRQTELITQLDEHIEMIENEGVNGETEFASLTRTVADEFAALSQSVDEGAFGDFQVATKDLPGLRFDPELNAYKYKSESNFFKADEWKVLRLSEDDRIKIDTGEPVAITDLDARDAAYGGLSAVKNEVEKRLKRGDYKNAEEMRKDISDLTYKQNRTKLEKRITDSQGIELPASPGGASATLSPSTMTPAQASTNFNAILQGLE